MRTKARLVSFPLHAFPILALTGVSCFSSVHADSQWVGNIDGVWTNAGNWSPSGVPTNTDAVTLNGLGTAPVIDNTSEAAQSVTVGNDLGAGVLTIQNGGLLTTQAQEDVTIGHTANIGQVTVTGTNSTLSSGGALTLIAPVGNISSLTINDGGGVVANGPITLGVRSIIRFTGTGAGSGLQSLVSNSIINNGTLLFDQSSGTITLSDQISGNGDIIASTGTGELTGDNAGFLGQFALIGGGTLQAGSANAFGGQNGLASAVVNGGTLDLNGNGTQFSSLSGNGGVVDMGSASILINQSVDTGYAGTIQGTGSLGKSGSGTLTLAGTNTFDGGTFLTGGTLELQGGSALLDTADVVIFSASTLLVTNSETVDDVGTEGAVTIANGATLTADAFNLQGGTLQGGTISASAFNFDSGTASSDLTGAGALTKSTTGTLTLSGANTYTGSTSVTAGTLLVNGSIDDVTVNGGTLGGSGTLGDAAINSGGTFAPGNSIGTTNVANVTFNAGSIYEVELNDGGFVAGTNNDLINATGTATINGGTVHVTPENGTDDGSTYTLGSYTIITAAGGGSGAFDAVTDDFAFLNFALEYNPNSVVLNSSLATSSFCLAGMTANQCATGEGAFSLGLGNSLFTAVLNLSDTEAPGALDQLSGEIHASAKTALIEDSRFVREATLDRLAGAGAEDPATVWIQGIGSWGHWDGDHNAAKLSRDTGGLLLGGDVAMSQAFRLGAFAGYTQSDFDVTARNSDGATESWHLGVYGGGHWDAWRLRVGGGWSGHDIDTARNVAFTGFSEALSADYDAHTLQAFGEAGYAIEYGSADVEPFARLAHVHLKTDGYTETGGDAALDAQSQDMDTTYATLGLRAKTAVNLRETTTQLSGSAGWRQAFGDIKSKTTHAFTGSDQFTVAGVPIAKDALVLDLGASMMLAPDTTLGLSYNGQFSSDLTDHGLKVNFIANF